MLSIKRSTEYLLKKQSLCFFDEEALLIDDPDHSEEEERFIILGVSENANVLVVCHCYREADTIIRIISARKATRTETMYYHNSFSFKGGIEP